MIMRRYSKTIFNLKAAIGLCIVFVLYCILCIVYLSYTGDQIVGAYPNC